MSKEIAQDINLDECQRLAERGRYGQYSLLVTMLIALARKAKAYEHTLDEISDGDLNYSECVDLARETLKKEDAR